METCLQTLSGRFPDTTDTGHCGTWRRKFEKSLKRIERGKWASMKMRTVWDRGQCGNGDSVG